jgi:hypothetical protein
MLLITKYIGYGMMGTYHFFLRLLIHLRVLRRRSGGGVRDRRGGQEGRRAGTGSRAAIFWSASNMRGIGTVCYSEESIQLRVPY